MDLAKSSMHFGPHLYTSMLSKPQPTINVGSIMKYKPYDVDTLWFCGMYSCKWVSHIINFASLKSTNIKSWLI